MALPVNGLVAVTGGARGIGRATAEAVIAAGARVAIGDLDREAAEATAEELGDNAVGLRLDVTDRDSFEAFWDAAVGRLGPIDVLVNNAGLMVSGRFTEEEARCTDLQVDVNLRGVLIGSQLALRHFEERGQGHLVNIASMAGKVAVPGGATYCATKHAVVGLTEALRAELRGRNIGVTLVMPGMVQTELSSGMVVGRMAGRSVEPREVAEAIVAALREERFEVFVPREHRRALRIGSLLPRRAREALARMAGSERALLGVDPGARDAYHRRATGVG